MATETSLDRSMMMNKRLKVTPASTAKVRSKSLQSLERARWLTTGCPLLDETLQGGLRTGCVHEIVGESNCGKTQLCLQLLLTSQWKKENGGLECKSLYINTEGSSGLTTTRLREFADFHASKGFLPGDGPNAGQETATALSMDNIFVEKCVSDDPSALLNVLNRAKALLQHHGVRLIVIDSMANAFKGFSPEVLDMLSDGASLEKTNQQVSSQRQLNLSQLMHRTVTLLKKYASDYNACVVLTNHVTDFVEENARHRATQAFSSALYASGKRVNASLGLAFAQCVNCRYFFARLHGIRLNENMFETSGCVRSFSVVFSPYQKRRDCKYIINQYGVWGIPETCLQHRQPETNHGEEEAADQQG
jgi:DNA-repair protein XRCC3